MIKAVRQHLQPPNNNFWDIEKNWYSFVPSFWILQRIFEANDVHGFELVPQFRPGSKHIRIDTVTMQLFRNEGKPDTEKIPYAQRDNAELIWSSDVFNFAEHNTFCNNSDPVRQFSNSIQTDGESVSMLFEKIKTRDVPSVDETERKNSIKKELENKEYKYIVGNDPGRKSVAFFNTLNTTTNTEKLTNFSALTFRYETGEFRRRARRIQLTEDAVFEKEQERRNFHLSPPTAAQKVIMEKYAGMFREKNTRYHIDQPPPTKRKKPSKYARRRARLQRKKQREHQPEQQPPTTESNNQKRRKKHRKTPKPKLDPIDDNHKYQLSSRSWNYVDFVRFQLKHMQNVHRAACNPDVTRLKLRKYICIQKCCHRIANDIVAGNFSYEKRDRRPTECKKNNSSRPVVAQKAVPPKRDVLYFRGTGDSNGPGITKGHVGTPIRKVEAILRRHADVVGVWEPYTTQKYPSVINNCSCPRENIAMFTAKK